MSSNSPLKPGLLLVLSAPSGAGKTTLARRLLKEMPDALFSVSHTTRGIRGKEQDGVDYRFVDVLSFKEKIECGEFVEWAEVHGHFYGSPQAVVDEALSKKGLAIFDIDVQGGQAIKRKYPETILTFILPPSMEELERRLRDRKTDSEETIHRRMLAARSEIERGVATYDYIIVNDDFERAFLELRSIVMAERCRRGRVDLAHLRIERLAEQAPSEG
jgi:guanylate kinase